MRLDENDLLLHCHRKRVNNENGRPLGRWDVNTNRLQNSNLTERHRELNKSL